MNQWINALNGIDGYNNEETRIEEINNKEPIDVEVLDDEG